MRDGAAAAAEVERPGAPPEAAATAILARLVAVDEPRALDEGDEWPKLRERVLAAGVFVLGTPFWLAQRSSIARGVFGWRRSCRRSTTGTGWCRLEKWR